ncbi:MAG: hypothetical protein CL447_03085 [Acidimicrobiaceae bacterium]|nr:hypothetical protein [Acidimicrobiaceae bacterium]
MRAACQNDINQNRLFADIVMKFPRAQIAIRISMAALTSFVTMQWHSASVRVNRQVRHAV